MTPQDLIAAFDVLADAPDGVARLRELVLSLAVRGKLVAQDLDDGAADKCLHLASAEKKRQRATKEIRRVKPVAPLPAAEEPFVLPDGWRWCRADDLMGHVTSGSRGWAKYYSDAGPLFLRIGNLDYGTTDLDLESVQRVQPPDGAEGTRTAVQSGDVLVSITGDTGMVGLVPEDLGPAYINQHIALCRPLPGVFPAYLATVFTSLHVRDQLWDYQRGIKNSLGLTDIRLLTVPLPPFAEQRRIVARVDELMGLLDRLEAARATRDEVRRAARDAALADLRDATDAEAVEAAWGRIAREMDDLFTHPDDVAPLRQAVLQLAVRGRLVAQDPGDEPASLAVDRARTEKARRVREGTLRRARKLEPMASDEVPFAAPSGWSVVQLHEVAVVGSGVAKNSSRGGATSVEMPYLRVANVQAGYLDLTTIKELLVPADKVEQYTLRAGDVLLTEGGDWDKLGRSAVWNGEIEPCLHQNHVFRVRAVAGCFQPQWLSMFTNSPDGRAYFQSCSKQTTNLASINKTQLRRCPTPIPPLAEQHRIIAKVDALMALCDDLEARLGTANDLHGRFAAAAVHHLDA